MWSRCRPWIFVAIVLAVAATLRFWGLRWGLPNALHSYSYHPDEFLTLGAAGFILTGFFPRLYNYPSLYLYLISLALAVASGYGLAKDVAAGYLCARAVTAIMGVAAVAAVYWAGKTLWAQDVRPQPDRQKTDPPGHVALDGRSPGHVAPRNYAIGLLAATILCIAPLHVQHSHFATVDVPSTLFVALCLGFAGQVLTRGSWRDYLLCGVMAGLAAGTKYNAALVILSLIAAHVLGSRAVRTAREHPEPVEGRSRSLTRILWALGAFLLAFVISTPGSIFRTRDFLHGLTYEMQHAAKGHGLVFAGTGNGFIFTFTSSLWYGLGPGLAILFVAAMIYGLVRLDKRALVILAFALPYYALISLSQVRFARYSLPLFPPAALLISWMACDLWSRFPKGMKWAWAGLIGIVLSGTLLYTIALDQLFVQESPQDRAARWIFANIPRGGKIGVFEVPWFYSPAYSKDVGFGTLTQRREAVRKLPYQLDIIAEHGYTVNPEDDWVVLSDYEIGDADRLQGCRDLLPADQSVVKRVNAAVEVVCRDYDQREQFQCDPPALSVIFWPVAFSRDEYDDGCGAYPPGELPHDMRYPAPTIWIYERKK